MGGPSRPHRRCSPPFRAWHRGNLRTASAVGYPPSNTWIVAWSTRPRRVANLIKGPRSVPGTSNTTRPPLSFSPSILIADTLSAIAATNVIGSSGAFAIGLPLTQRDGQIAVVPFPLHLTLQVPLHFRPPPLQGRHLAGGDLGAREQFVVRFHPVGLLRAERAAELVVVDQRPFGEGLPAPPTAPHHPAHLGPAFWSSGTNGASASIKRWCISGVTGQLPAISSATSRTALSFLNSVVTSRVCLTRSLSLNRWTSAFARSARSPQFSPLVPIIRRISMPSVI